MPRPCGCGLPRPAPPPTTWTDSGRHFSAVSIWSTPSASRSRPSAGPHRNSTPKLRTPEAADRWTWILIAAHTQLRLARPLAEDLRRPWKKPALPNRLTPARVRRGLRNIRAHLLCPARVPQPRGAGPGRPLGTKNKHRAPRYDVGKTVKRPENLKAIGKPGRSW